MDCGLPGSFVQGIFQAGILEWVAIPLSRGSSRARDWTWVCCTAGICTYNTNINTHIQQICDECPRFNSPEWQRKSESRMESNLLKTDCLKEEREVVFPKAKKKKNLPCTAVLSRMSLITLHKARNCNESKSSGKCKKKIKLKTYIGCKPAQFNLSTRYLDSTQEG